jgi:hypothetical protein
MSNQSPKHENGGSPRKRWYRLSATDIGTFLALYGFGFLVCRFDLSRHHSFEHPMSNRNAAIWGLVLTIVFWGFSKLKDKW